LTSRKKARLLASVLETSLNY